VLNTTLICNDIADRQISWSGSHQEKKHQQLIDLDRVNVGQIIAHLIGFKGSATDMLAYLQ
jgi:hypothetical protein